MKVWPPILVTRLARRSPRLASLSLFAGTATGWKFSIGASLLFCLLAATCAPARAEHVAAGITEAVCDVILSPSVAGLVSSWKYKEGDFVESGAVIIELDNKMEQLEVERRKLAMENKQTDWEAVRKLNERNSISVRKEEVEKAETDYRIAVAEHKMAVEQLRRRSITAPCSGYIAEIVRDPGEAADEYQPIVRVVDTRRCYFTSNVEAKAAGRLKLDQTVKLEIQGAAKPVELSGKIAFLSPVVDPASGLQKVKVLFDNSDGRIRPGVAGKMHFD